MTLDVLLRSVCERVKNGATFGATTAGTVTRQEGSPDVRGRILNPNPRTRSYA